MRLSALCATTGVGLLLCLLAPMDAATAQQRPCPPETGYQPTAESGHLPTDDATWCGRQGDYWTETLENASKKAACTTGTRQSPVAVTTQQANGSPGILSQYTPEDVAQRVQRNTGHSVQLEFDPAERSFRIYGATLDNWYDLMNVHFHYPSEHTLDGERFALEIHLVHKSLNRPDKAVLALLVRKGDLENRGLKAIFDQMPTASGATRTITFDSINLVYVFQRGWPPRGGWVSYKGSLTTPTGDTGCDENVKWFVYVDPIIATQAQIDQFKAAISYHPFKVNARPLTDEQGNVRSLSGRDALRYIPPR
jgi:carbonic anhydrase